jgi:hypothetical protein
VCGVLLAVAISLTACSSGSSGSASPHPSSTKGTVQGTVSPSKGNAKLKGAHVALVKNGKTTAKPTVKPTGKFTAKVAAGTYKVNVTGAGTCQSKSVKVKAGKTAKVTVTCKPKS